MLEKLYKDISVGKWKLRGIWGIFCGRWIVWECKEWEDLNILWERIVKCFSSVRKIGVDLQVNRKFHE